jgi:3-oxoacyl-(acyl-carrier-protein) synthase
MASHIAGQAPELPEVPDSIGPYTVEGRPLTLATHAALEAMAEAGIDDSCDIRPDRRAVVVAGGFDDQMLVFLGRAADKATAPGQRALDHVTPDDLLPQLLEDGGLAGMDRYSQVRLMQAIAHLFQARQASTVSTACAGGPQAIGDAIGALRTGRADIALAMGVDTLITREMMGGFCNLTALSTRNDDPTGASRPFDENRDGFVMGEGAACLVLEREENARARGATILAEMAGIGYSSDAYRLTDPHPEGTGMALSMRRALEDAGLKPEDVESINAHGTSTAANDKAETKAIRMVFGEHADQIAVSATKSMIGHLIHGAGAVGAVVAVKTITDQKVHPTANYETVDPLCDLDYVGDGARSMDVSAVLVNAFGFGGQNATLAITRYEG